MVGSRAARRFSWRLVANLLAVSCVLTTLACSGGGGGGSSTRVASPNTTPPPTTPPPTTPPPTTPPPTTPPPTPTPMQTVEVRFEPSSSDGVLGYSLSVATDSGAFGSGTQIDIPVTAARVEAGGVLAYDVQMSANVPHYLAMRAYSSETFSPYSNEIEIPAVAATATVSTALASTAAIGEETSGMPATSTGSAGAGSTSMAGTSGSGSASGTSASGSESTTANSASAAAMSSLDFDGAGEFLASLAAQPLGASNQFTLSVWAAADPSATGPRALVSVRGGSGATQNRVELTSAGGELALSVTNDAGQLVYSAAWSGALVPGDWQHLALTFDASIDSAPMLLVDGTARAPSSANLTGNPAVFGDSAGRVFVGGSGNTTGTTGTWLGAIGHVAFFGLALGDDEIAEIFVRGHALDLRSNAGAYQASDALLHYWRLGEDPNAVGYDSGSAATPIDLDDPSGYVDAGDILADAPVLLP